MATKPVQIVKKSFRTRKRIKVVIQQGEEELSVNTTDNELPSFDKARAALLPIVGRILGVTEEWLTSVSARILGVDFGEIGDVDTAAITVELYLRGAAKGSTVHLPPRMMAQSTTPGTTGEPLTAADAELLYDFAAESKGYFNGKRAQGLLPGIGGNGSDDDDGAGGGEGEDAPGQIKFPGTEGAPTPGQGEDGQPAEKKKAKRAKKKK